jgi:hypothetical protein
MSMNATGSLRATPPRAAHDVSSADLRKPAPSPSPSPSGRGLGVGLSRALAEADANANANASDSDDASEEWDDEQLRSAIGNASAAPAPPGPRPTGPFGDEGGARSGAQRGKSNAIGGRAAATAVGASSGAGAAADADATDGFAAGFAAASVARREAMTQFSEERAASVADKRAAAALLDPAAVSRFGLAAKMREGHGLGVYSVAWADDGRHLASCSHDGSVVVWDTEVRRRVGKWLGRERRDAPHSAHLCTSFLFFKRARHSLTHAHALLRPPHPRAVTETQCAADVQGTLWASVPSRLLATRRQRPSRVVW